MRAQGPDRAAVLEAFATAWEPALAAWSALTLLRRPQLLADEAAAQAVGMAGQLAAIRLADATILVHVERFVALGLHGCEAAVLAHEIGHHVLVPGNLADHARMFAALRRTLAGLAEGAVALCANLWADSLINDRLVRDGLDEASGADARAIGAGIVQVYRRLHAADGGGSDRVWCVYARSLEILWRQPADSFIAADAVDDDAHADATLLARIVRALARDPVRGARRYAAVLYPALAADAAAGRDGASVFVRRGLHDTDGAARDASGGDADVPAGLIAIDDAESEPLDGDQLPGRGASASTSPVAGGGSGANQRTPFEFGQLLRALGLRVDDHAVITRYYKELALPHLVPFPRSRRAPTSDAQLEGLDPWAGGDAIEDLDLFSSLLQSPVLVPGVTTVQRHIGEVPGAEPAARVLDLDIYVDCSGSMPDPHHQRSFLTLAATILALSCLRAGGRVQATLWSGPGVFDSTHGFVRDERRVLGMVTGFVSGMTAFPLHLLRDTYAARRRSDPPAHVVVISDDGIDTMLADDERGRPGAEVAAEALATARGCGTLVLHLPQPAAAYRWASQLEAVGFAIHRVRDLAELVAFARAFARAAWSPRGEGAA